MIPLAIGDITVAIVFFALLLLVVGWVALCTMIGSVRKARGLPPVQPARYGTRGWILLLVLGIPASVAAFGLLVEWVALLLG